MILTFDDFIFHFTFYYILPNQNRSNLSQRFQITSDALHNLTEWPDISVPITNDDLLPLPNTPATTGSDGMQYAILNKTAFLSQLKDFR